MFVSRFHCSLRSPSCFVSSLRYLVSVANRRAMSSHEKLRSYLVTPAELNSALKLNASKLSHEPRIIPLCASWFLPNDDRNGYETFLAQHIPHSQFFDLDAVKDVHSPYPHMLPSPSEFADAVRHLGIRREDSVVVYDSKELGIFSAPRVGWTFQVFGHPRVHVLNNFRKWVEEGYPTESGEPKAPEITEYEVPQLDEKKVIAFEQVKEIAKELGKEGADEVQILDARSLGRWKGVDPEPREGLSSGHIPFSISVPVADLLDPNDKTLLPASKLKAVFESKGIKPDVPIISSCGTGVTAAIIDAALTEAGYPTQQRRLYDGSWTEWAQRVKPTEGLIHKTL
ncbi:hypothetical protein COCMIDRAFT_100620 [Bipolaris oryzae ATCC 44560]|uniref:Rhodanese domain-containing protein n=1 Tax=Bipolaris oryzae ATCC 44560 TaxID=930090 RepID=W6Z0J7_COCMI|nr:uncharacterized protein COCMIDRAFT_100620 [Bipolaris oryzae ATCC 44560]EUC43485.1 hypothetical protein COCMIDRAFT_100620 [Bipolaris oryzae ATCC 44560]